MASSTKIDDFSIYPITSESVTSHRYTRPARVERSHAHISAGPFSEPEPTYLPQNWSAYTHPEGQLYFYNDGPLKIVTEAYLYNTIIADKISRCIHQIAALLLEKQMALGESAELCLQLDEEDSCGYYFVDHATRTQFWIHDMSTEDLGLFPVMTTSHLKFALEELYWSHVEFFPMHLCLRHQAIEELISVFAHARADRLTSPTSTFPYTAEQCANFLDLLRGSREDVPSGYTTSFVARLWGSVSNYRFMNHHGQELPRLSRDQPILSAPAPRAHWSAGLTSKLMYGFPDTYRARLDEMFVDDFLHGSEWLHFMETSFQDWKLSLSLAFPLLVSSLLLSFVHGTAPAIAFPSIIVSTLSIISGIILIFRHESLKNASCPAAIDFLQATRSPSYGFAPLALIYALPRALALHALLLFLAQGLYIAVQLVSPRVAECAVLALAIFVCVVRRTVWPSAPSQTETVSEAAPKSGGLFACLGRRRHASADTHV